MLAAGGAKTSEYKYFKKLCEEAGHKCCSYQVPVQEINLKTSKERDGAASRLIYGLLWLLAFQNEILCSFCFSS